MMKKVCYLLLTAWLCVSAQAEVRTWTDTVGRTVEAEMTGVESGRNGTEVLLKLDDKRVVSFPYSQLSAQDQAYVRKNMPFEPKRAAEQIDRLLQEGLERSNAQIRAEQSKVASDREMNREDRLKLLDELAYLEEMTHPTPRTTDEQFVRRAYLNIAGRIPTYAETLAFLGDDDREKRYRLIDDLIESEAFVSHFFNYLSDLLRIRSDITPNGVPGLQGRAYMDWMKDQLRAKRGWDEIVSDLMVAKGNLWENPAVGYIYTDYNMLLCNVSNTFTVFLGTEITCAQCHDHPFEEVYQMDFYRTAAFFGNLEYKIAKSDKVARIEQEESRLQGEMRKLKPGMKSDQMLSNLASAYRFTVQNGEENQVRLPPDYKYDDGDPHDSVQPATYFGQLVDLEQYESPREAFAHWLTSKENPRFSVNVANRLWKFAFGLAQVEPVDNLPGHLDDQAENYDLLVYLETLIKDLDYNLQDFMRVLFYTETWQREACHQSPTLAQIDQGEYHFPAPILRRMTAEQIWDSMVTLTTSDPDEYETRVLEKYKTLMDRDWSNMSGRDALVFRDEYRTLDRFSIKMADDTEMDDGRVDGELMVRASEMKVPAQAGHFLETFGQSDKKLIENSTQLGSVPQVLMMMNGKLTNQTLSSADSKIMQDALKIRGRGDTVDAIFLSILNRYPTQEERSKAQASLSSARRDESTNQSAHANLIWALLNTREFLFIQ